jgi:CRP-like cAMP-binding protein
MAAEIRILRTRADRLRSEQAVQLRDLVTDIPDLPMRAVNEMIGVIDRLTAADHGWIFVMVDVVRHRNVVRWLMRNSSRPLQAVELWAQCFVDANHQTGEILLSRQEMARELGIPPTSVSHIMSELVKVGALSRLRRDDHPNAYRYFMNPRIATSLTGKARDDAQQAAREPAAV